MNFLIIGSGSIGDRHIGNLKSISDKFRIFVYEKNEDRLKSIVHKHNVTPVDNLFEILQEKPFSGALICTPPSTHIRIARQVIKHNIPLLIEKPLSNTLKGVKELMQEARRRKVPVLVGYNLHFHTGIILIRKLLKKKVIGKPLAIRIEAGQYLPDWRPWQDYRQSYTARKDLGGGIILDGSHELDYLLWFMSGHKPTELISFCGTVSNLDVETEDTAEILIRFETGLVANIHLDFIQRIYARSCKIIGDKGTISWNYNENTVKIYNAQKKKWKIFHYQYAPNDMYVAEIKHFLKVVRGKEKPFITVEEGRDVLELALAAKKSEASGRKILFNN